MTTPANLFVPAALAALAMLAAPAQADTVRDHRAGATRPAAHHRATPRNAPRAGYRSSRPIIQPPGIRGRDGYRYDGGGFTSGPVYDSNVDGRVWIPGEWQWSGHQRVWVEGRWVAERPGLTDPGPSWVHPRDRWSRAPEDWTRN